MIIGRDLTDENKYLNNKFILNCRCDYPYNLM